MENDLNQNRRPNELTGDSHAAANLAQAELLKQELDQPQQGIGVAFGVDGIIISYPPDLAFKNAPPVQFDWNQLRTYMQRFAPETDPLPLHQKLDLLIERQSEQAMLSSTFREQVSRALGAVIDDVGALREEMSAAMGTIAAKPVAQLTENQDLRLRECSKGVTELLERSKPRL